MFYIEPKFDLMSGKTAYATQFLYFTAICIAKIAILCFILTLELFKDRRIVYGITGLVASWFL